MKKLSVIIPVYNEVNLEPSIKRVIDILVKAGIEYEIILVDDGSKNNAWNEISDIKDKYSGIIGIAFSRNFGKESALCAGLDNASGDCAICLDADMQFPPEVIPEMYKLWEQGWEVVEGVKKKRQKTGFIYNFCSVAFYNILKKTSGIDLNNASDFRLLDRAAIDAWKSMPEKQTFFRGMSTWVGFKRYKFEFDVADRLEGESKWSAKGLISFAIDSVTSYTAAPLHIASVTGFLFLIFAIIMAVQTLYMKFTGNAQSGFTTVILIQLITSAIMLMCVGILGIYIKKIYEETKNRPRYIISRIIKSEKENDD